MDIPFSVCLFSLSEFLKPVLILLLFKAYLSERDDRWLGKPV